MIKRIIRAIRNRVPVYRKISQLQRELTIWKKGLYPPGHYYSPVYSASTLNTQSSSSAPGGIDLNDAQQYALLRELRNFYDESVFPENRKDGYRYYFLNEYFSYSDGMFLQAMIRYLKPKKIIEVGSGFSSALMLDVNERFFGDDIKLTFIEPFPEERLNLLIDGREGKAKVLKEFVQDVSKSLFEGLEPGDILFIDSSHISKFNSDLNFILFEIVPVLKRGVYIHFHDIFYPFEYPKEWIMQGRSWNEAYLLKAFLQYNSTFEITLFTSYLEQRHRAWFIDNMPLCLKSHEWITLHGEKKLMATGGQSIYLLKR
jgi:predicted O-methyltransferase YrrM